MKKLHKLLNIFFICSRHGSFPGKTPQILLMSLEGFDPDGPSCGQHLEMKGLMMVVLYSDKLPEPRILRSCTEEVEQ